MSLSLQTRLTAFSLYDLRNTIIRFSENEIYEDSTEIESQCRSLGFIFRKELMSFGDSRDTHRRSAIIANYTQNQKDAILAMSEHFQLDERECERYVKQAMNHDETQHLGTILGYQFSPLQSDLGTIATEFYYMDCDSLLDSILFLFRARKNDRLNDLNRQSIIMITNQMLKQKIGPILMNILCKFAEILCDRNEIYTAQRHMTAKRYIVRVARCLFYVFYNTLLVEDEVRRLLACVRELSNRCKTPISDQNDGIKSQWQYQLFAALVVVQVTQMRALQHDTPLFRRDVNEAPGVGLDPGHDESWDNPLAFDPVRLEDPDFKAPKSMGSDGPDFLAPRAMDSDGPSIWDCRLARGLCSLVYAVLCDGEDSTDNSAHMKRLLDAAANTRAFSYLRICMVPFLQSSSCLDIELQLDLTEALCGFVQRILEILNSRFDMSTSFRTGFPTCLKLRSEFESIAFYKGAQNINSVNFPPFELPDCLDDILELVHAVGCAFPHFATSYWQADALGQVKPAKIIFNTAKDRIAEESIRGPLLRFFVGLTGGGRVETAANGMFHFYEQRLGLQQFHWGNLFNDIETATHDMMSIADTAKDDAERDRVTEEWHVLMSANMEFICAAVQPKDCAESLQVFRPIEKLFALLKTPIFPDLRGAIFHTMASLVLQSGAYTEVVWGMLEDARLLPAHALARPGSHASDLRHHLEHVESTIGQYHTTDGFLSLLAALLTHGDPNRLGLGTRRPGVLVYLEFVLNEVLAKAPGRQYENAAERWRLTARAVHVLRVLLDKYPINEVYSARNSETSAFSSSVTQGIPEFLRQQVEYDFSRESEINESPKTAGFTLMSWLLGGGTLLDVLFEVLNDNLRLESEFEERIPSSVVKSLKILSETSLSSFHHVEIGRNLHLEGRADFDLDYWQQAAVTASVGLLFDFSQKESSFIDLVNRAGFVLHITTSNEARPAKQPVNVSCPLAVRLLSHRSIETSPLSLIARFVQGSHNLNFFSGSLSIMSTGLLKHAASLRNADLFTAALQRDSDGFVDLKRRCVRMLQNRGDKDLFELDSTGIPRISSQGADREFDKYLPAKSTDPTRKFSPIESSVLDSVLDLILNTLFENKLGLSHFLLGFEGGVFSEFMERGTGRTGTVEMSHPVILSKNLPDPVPGIPENCFHAILDLLLSTDQESANLFSLVRGRPSQAKSCLQIIYRLSAARNTSAITLALLRKKSVNFFDRLLKICMYERDQLQQLLIKADGAFDGEEKLRELESIHSDVADVEHCISWLLKICAIEIKILREANVYNFRNNVIFNLFKTSEDALNLGQQHGYHQDHASISPIIYLLQSVFYSASSDADTQTSSWTALEIECIRSSLLQPKGDSKNSLVDLTKLNNFLQFTQYEDIDDPIGLCEKAVAYNFLQRRAHAGESLCGAAWQLISVCIFDCPEFFIGEAQSSLSASYIIPDAEAQEKLNFVVASLLFPLLNILVENASAPATSLEKISKTLLFVMNVVNKASEVRVFLSLEQYEGLMKKFLEALLQRGSYAEGTGFGISNSSERYRGYLNTCLAHLLRYSSSVTPVALKSQFRMHALRILELRPKALAETLGLDIVRSKAPESILWGRTATSLLSLVFASLGPFDEAANSSVFTRGAIDLLTDEVNEDFRFIYGSHAFLQILQVLSARNRNYLQHIVESTDLRTSDAQELQTMLGLYTNIALNTEGVRVLLDCGIAKKLLEIERFNAIDIFPRDRDDFGDIESAECLLALLRLLRALVSELPSKTVLSLCMRFMYNNYGILSELMNATSSNRPLTLAGLQLVESTSALISLVASTSSFTADKGNEEDSLSMSVTSKWDGGLGQHAEPFRADLVRMLHSIGTNLFPGHHYQGMRKAGEQRIRDSSSWWSQILPSSAFESEQKARDTQRPIIVDTRYSHRTDSWSVFDNRVFDLGLRTLRHTALALRLHAADSAVMEVLMPSIDIQAIANVFCSCATLLVEVASTDNVAADEGDVLKVYSVENSFVTESLQFIVENLICVLHYIVSMFSTIELKTFEKELDDVVRLSEEECFDIHSLVRNTARWIKEHRSRI